MTNAANMGALRYSDPLVAIDHDQIRIKCYHVWGGDKRVRWENVESIRAMTPTLWNGKWRMWGTGGFTTWFGCDFDRPMRQTIFVMKLRTQRTRVGFTVHDAAKVKQILAERGVLEDLQGDTPPAKPLPPPRPLRKSAALWTMLVLLAAVFGEAVYFYPQMPARIATHFNLSGDADGWGPRQMLIVLPIVVAFVAGMFLLVALACRQTAASVFGEFMLWVGTGAVAFVGFIGHLAYRANLTATPSLGRAPLYALIAFLLCIPASMLLLLRKLK